MEKKCPICGAKIKEDYRFCAGCGVDFSTLREERENRWLDSLVSKVKVSSSKMVSCVKEYFSSPQGTPIPVQTQEEKETPQEKADRIRLENLLKAIDVIFEYNQATISIFQRRLAWTYEYSSQIMEELEVLEIVGPYDRNAPRAILPDDKGQASWMCQRNVWELDERIERKRENERIAWLLSQAGIVENLDLSQINALQVIGALESNISAVYKDFFYGAKSQAEGKAEFEGIEKACKSSVLPLAAEVRLETLLDEYREKFENPNPLAIVDHMEGYEFEEWCAGLLRKLGYSKVEVTKASGDQGVDVLAVKDEIRYAIQCKCYTANLGNTPVQEIHAGRKMYRCQIGVVMTNRYFTSGAKELAEATGILLWDRDRLQQMIDTTQCASILNAEKCVYMSDMVKGERKQENDIFIEAVENVLETNSASVSMLQRRLKLGYNQASNIMDEMEELGIVGPFNGSTPRAILISKEQWDKTKGKIFK